MAVNPKTLASKVVDSTPLDDADPTYTHFAHRAQFMSLLERFLAVDLGSSPSQAEEDAEVDLVKQMGEILDYYLPMPGLLDPALDSIVPPLMDIVGVNLALLAKGATPAPNHARLARLGRLVNWVVKVRGWKAVVPYFPSTLPHLTALITLLSSPSSSWSRSIDILHHPALTGEDAWELRAVLLLWLALLLTVPFSLVALSSDSPAPTGLDIPTHTRLFSAPTSDLAVRVTLLALPLLQRPGREGAYAALVLARLFAREDAVQGLPGFFKWATAELSEGERESEANLVTSLLTFLALLPGMAAPSHLPTAAGFFSDDLIPHLAGGSTSASSGLVRKMAIKARGRWWLARLRGIRDDQEAEIPEGVEELLDDLMSALGDKDTIVRYSAAKYLARIAALLPSEFGDQIVGATIGQFAGTEEEPVIETAFGMVIDPGGSVASNGAMGLGGLEATRGEARWHGVCLAVAELARRGLLSPEAVAEAVPWVVKALTFDLRRASHSVGTNVRDAASYVLWSLSRAAAPDTLRPFAEEMATVLVCVALFDREVGVRRAASAAFQEGVGRLGLYPAGIDVLAKTDFYSVSVRRKAFTVAAPAVAEHAVYRKAMREHLHNITLRHWDTSMRIAGAAALNALLKLAPEDIPDSIAREKAQIPSLDPTSAHGALVALTQIAPLISEAEKDEVVATLTNVRAAALITSNAPEIVAAGCSLVGAGVTATTDLTPFARFFDAAIRRHEGDVHEALAKACGRLSTVRDAKSYVTRSITDLNSARAAQRQAAALCLGHYVYRSHEGMQEPLNALFSLLEPAAKADVETRRNTVRSLADVSCQRDAAGNLLMAKEDYPRVINALTAALEDYTTDPRGDVGSWIRQAAARALGRIIGGAASLGPFATILIPPALFAGATSGIAKQAFEKLDVVREASTEAWSRLLAAKAQDIWDWPGATVMLQEDGDIRPAAEWFTSGLQLLRTPARASVVAGLIQSAGSIAHSNSARALTPLSHWLTSLPAEDATLLTDTLSDITTLLGANISSNRIAIHALQTFARLCDAGVADCRASEAAREADAAAAAAPYGRVLACASRGVPTLKSMDRIGAAMRVTVAGLGLPFVELRVKAATLLAGFLSHRFPRIRTMTSEALYLALSEGEIDPELEELLLETTWGSDEAMAVSPKVVELVRQQVEEEQVE